MRRRNDPRLPACRRTYRSSTVACFWTLFSVSAGVALHPLPIAAQTDFGRLSVNPFLSLNPTQLLSRWARSEDGESSGVLKAALIGAAIGGIAGAVVFEVASSQLCGGGGFFGATSGGCTVTPSRGRSILIGALLGGAVGAVVAVARGSAQSWTPLPFASLHGGWGLHLSRSVGW